MNAEQRRAYIDTARRSQPLTELERKARKATPRHFKRVFGGVEGVDLTLAKHWRWCRGHDRGFQETFRYTFCSLCSSFAGAVGQPVIHKITCSANPIDDGPYPGWAASGRLVRPMFEGCIVRKCDAGMLGSAEGIAA